MRTSLSALTLVVLAAHGCRRPPSEGDRAIPRGGAAAEGPVADGAALHERASERDAMVDTQLAQRDIRDAKVLAAMRRVPRHAFVPEPFRADAYEDHPLPIPGGQTISQPYIVAFMTQAAAPRPDDRCLEIGTGSGYQAAVLAELCGDTYSVEYIDDVARFGRENLERLGYAPARVKLRVGDGYRGWPEAAPFHVILVTAAPDRVPPPLLDQLAIAGRLVIPVGSQDSGQDLERWTRLRAGRDAGAFRVDRLLGVRFVPFLGDGAPG